MNFCKLIGYKMRRIFLEILYTKWDGEILFPDPFLEKPFFIFVCQVEGYRNILKLSCRPFAFTLCKAF